MDRLRGGADIASESARSALLEVVATHWWLGSRLLADVFIPGASTEERAAFARLQRQSATSEQATQSLAASYAVDVPDHIAQVRVPTSVIHRRDNRGSPSSLASTWRVGSRDRRSSRSTALTTSRGAATRTPWPTHCGPGSDIAS